MAFSGLPSVRLFSKAKSVETVLGVSAETPTYDPKIVVIAGHFFEYFPKLKLEFELKLSQYCHQEENQIKR